MIDIVVNRLPYFVPFVVMIEFMVVHVGAIPCEQGDIIDHHYTFVAILVVTQSHRFMFLFFYIYRRCVSVEIGRASD